MDLNFTTNSPGTDVYKFAFENLPAMERIAVGDFCDMEAMLKESPLLRKSIYCFFLFESGEAEVTVNGYEERLRPHELICGIPNDAWEWKIKKNVNGKFIFFDASFLLAGLKGGYTIEIISCLNQENHYPFIPLSDRRYNRLKLLIEDMEECLSEIPIFYDLLRAQLWQFVFLTEKEYIVNGNPGRRLSNPNYIPTFINLVNRFYNVSHESGFYAEKMNISPNYLNKIVKKALGCSVYDFILNRIISEAKLSLRLTEISVNELAYKLGFESPNYFIRCFKKMEGITPGQYQKRGTL